MKSLTIELDEETWDLLMRTAEGENLSMADFLHQAALHYIKSELQVSNEEMADMLADRPLSESIKDGLKEIEEAKYTLLT